MDEDRLTSESISANLGTQFTGKRVIYFSSLPSTMLAAREEARSGAVEGTVILADEQSAGRGRRERTWLSPKGGVALSVILRPRLPELPSLIMVASLAVVHSIAATTGLAPQIKWPNDVLIDGRKVCGILIENELRGERVERAVIGIGINVNMRMADFPEIEPIATSLSDELGRTLSRLELVRRLLVELEKKYLALRSGRAVFEEWRATLATLGRRVQVSMGAETLEGIAEEVARDGSLLLRQPDGSLTRVVAGEVSLRQL